MQSIIGCLDYLYASDLRKDLPSDKFPSHIRDTLTRCVFGEGFVYFEEETPLFQHSVDCPCASPTRSVHSPLCRPTGARS